MSSHGKSEASEKRQARDKEILRLRLIEDWTLERIAEEFRLTKQRVFQIVHGRRQ